MSAFKVGGSQYEGWYANSNVNAFLVDSYEELSQFDLTVLSPGTKATTNDGAHTWVLGTDMLWHEWNQGGGGGVTKQYVDQADANLQEQIYGKQDTIADLATIRSGAEAGATAVQPDDLDEYATQDYVAQQIAALPTETWTFTLDDDTTVTKKVVVTE